MPSSNCLDEYETLIRELSATNLSNTNMWNEICKNILPDENDVPSIFSNFTYYQKVICHAICFYLITWFYSTSIDKAKLKNAIIELLNYHIHACAGYTGDNQAILLCNLAEMQLLTGQYDSGVKTLNEADSFSKKMYNTSIKHKFVTYKFRILLRKFVLEKINKVKSDKGKELQKEDLDAIQDISYKYLTDELIQEINQDNISLGVSFFPGLPVQYISNISELICIEEYKLNFIDKNSLPFYIIPGDDHSVEYVHTFDEVNEILKKLSED